MMVSDKNKDPHSKEKIKILPDLLVAVAVSIVASALTSWFVVKQNAEFIASNNTPIVIASYAEAVKSLGVNASRDEINAMFIKVNEQILQYRKKGYIVLDDRSVYDAPGKYLMPTPKLSEKYVVKSDHDNNSGLLNKYMNQKTRPEVNKSETRAIVKDLFK